MTVGKHSDKARRVDRMSGYAGALPKCKDGTEMTSDHTSLLVRSSA